VEKRLHLNVFMLQTTTDGKKTSSRGTVGDSKLYDTVDSLNSAVDIFNKSFAPISL
jgi:hypothetical protein